MLRKRCCEIVSEAANFSMHGAFSEYVVTWDRPTWN